MSAPAPRRLRGVKICGLTREEDVRLAARLGAAALGVVFAESPRRLDTERAALVLRDAPRHVLRVGVFVDPVVDDVLRAVDACGLDWVQLSGRESADDAGRIGGALAAEGHTGVGLLAAIHVRSADDIAAHSDFPADAVLLDAPARAGRMGGTGARFDWSLAARLPWPRERVVLAGGLRAGNVHDAVTSVGPGAVDVCSGVESAPGIKDPVALATFLAAAADAFSRNGTRHVED